MNPVCLVCEEPATRVCIHPSCDKNPFLCGGKCKYDQNLSLSLHTHEGKTQFVPCKQLFSRVKQIKQKTDLSTSVNYTVNQIKKYINELKQFVQRYQILLKGKQLKLKKNISSTLDNLKVNGRNHKLTGKQARELLKLQNVTDDDCLQYKMVQISKEQVSQILGKLQNLDISSKLNPEKAQIYSRNGKKLFQLMRYKQAVKEFQIAQKINPFQIKYRIQIEECEKKNRQTEKQRGMTKDQKLFDLGIDAIENKKFREAILNFTRAIQINPNQAVYYRNRGNCFDQLGNDQKAIDDFTKAVQINPKDDSAFNNRALIYSKIGNEIRAIEDYDKAISIDPKTHGYYFNRAISHAKTKNYKKAIEDLSEAISLDLKNSFFYYQRGLFLIERGEAKKSIQDFSRAIQLKPRRQYYRGRASAYMKIGEFGQAKADQVLQHSAQQ